MNLVVESSRYKAVSSGLDALLYTVHRMVNNPETNLQHSFFFSLIYFLACAMHNAVA
jgi:hypothetical protein